MMLVQLFAHAKPLAKKNNQMNLLKTLRLCVTTFLFPVLYLPFFLSYYSLRLTNS